MSNRRRTTQTSTTLARRPFGLAADDYVTARKLELAPASQAKEKQLLLQLRAYFKEGPLKAITAKRIIEYGHGGQSSLSRAK